LTAHHVAVVGERPISLAHLDQRVAAVRRGPRGRHLPPDGAFESVSLRRWIVQELVTEEVLAHEARALGIIGAEAGRGASREPGRGGMTSPALPPAAVARLVELVTASVSVAPHEVRAYYERNRDRYRRRAARRVRHALLPDAASARRAARRLATGEDVGAPAEAHSTDAGTRTRGGELTDVHLGELTGPLEDAIFGAEIGAIVGPIRTEHGWHVARVEVVAPESYIPYAEARPAIEAELVAAARTRVFASWLEGRRLALAVIEPEWDHPAHPIHGVPSHRH
jgi:[acyl-carrier-protein] S-malonyltransferase